MKLTNESGFALVAALWLLVAFSAIGLEFSIRARAQRLEVTNGIEAASLRAAADGGIETAYALLHERLAEVRRHGSTDPNRLIDPWSDLLYEEGERSPAGNRTELDRVGHPGVSVLLRDAGAFLNPNLASEEQLRRFFLALRLDLRDADRLAQAILDWRDADQARRGRGAEREEYLREGLPALPSNRPFVRLAELRLVRGMTDQIYRRALPMLSLSGTGRINANQAHAAVLLSLPGMTEAAVAALERRAASGHPIRNLNDLLLELSEGPRSELQAASAELQGRVLFETHEMLATATATQAGSPVTVRTRGLFVRAGDAVVLTGRQAD